ncbi:MAG: SRPBCC family protein, partial [Aurantibacter sp.]
SDYKNWEAWLPWKEQDPTMKISYDEQTKGVGASYSWESEQGPGSSKMTAAVTNESITSALDFGEMGTSLGLWKFKEVDGGTELTWGMKTEETPFMMKVFSAMSGGYDNMIGPMFERGLEKLDSITQIQAEEYKKAMSAWSLGDIVKKPMEAQKFIGYHHTGNINDHEGLEAIYMESMPKAGTYAAEKGLQYGEYVPSAIFNKTDMESGEVDFLVGLFLKKDLAPAEGMQAVTFPAGDVVMVPKFGNYGTGDMEAHAAIDKFMTENNLTVNGRIYEMYMNDPTTVQPNEIQTDIYYPVK